MPNASRPGDLLAGRYRLVDLLTESGGGRFWRAYDRVLERHVALHVIRADDSRADGLMAAARRSAAVHDQHLLRVLDADHTGEVCYVVNEWGWGASLDIVVAGTGPLGPRRAAWLVSEVASAMAVAHAAGVSHGRLVPENILVDRTGGIRIIGLSVDAALHGLPPDRMGTDIADIAGLLYCALTTTWGGTSDSAVPPAPREHGAVLRPRRVRAGVPRDLDVLCDEILVTRGSRNRDLPDLQSARAIADYLADFVGDPLGMPEALVASTPDVLPDEELVVLPPVPEMAVKLDDPPLDPITPEIEPERPVEERPTEAGLPIFGDDPDDVSWLQKSTEPVPPPPPFEAPPERPLFAPDPPAGTPVRQARTPVESGDTDAGFWPWGDGASAPASRPAPGTGTAVTSTRPAGRPGGRRVAVREADDGTRVGLPAIPEDVPGRSFLRIAAGLIVAVLLLVAVVVAINLGRGKTALGKDPAPSSSARPRVTDSGDPSPSTSASTGPGGVLDGVTGRVLDPQGDGTENDADVPLALDGKPGTAWTTSSYFQQFGPGGIKDGVGLTLDLGAVSDVTAVDLTFVGAPTTVSLYLVDTPPTGVAGLSPVATGTATGNQLTLDATAGTRGRYLVVWLTRIPASGQNFKGGIAEVAVHGS